MPLEIFVRKGTRPVCFLWGGYYRKTLRVTLPLRQDATRLNPSDGARGAFWRRWLHIARVLGILAGAFALLSCVIVLTVQDSPVD